MLPLTPKSNNIFSRKPGSGESFLLEISLSFLDGIFNKSNSGSLNLFFSFSLILSAFIKGKSS